MLTPEQTAQIKEQLFKQIEKTFPDDKKEPVKKQIEAMDPEQLEKFLEQNKLIKQDTGEQKCVFCSIVFGDIPSYKLDENDKAIAVLEINPISKGHSLVIPKEHASKEKQSPEVLSLAKDLSKKIKTKLKPKEVKLASANLFGHEILNLIPIYKDETPESERKQETPEELEKLQKILKEKTEEKVLKKTKKSKRTKEKLWLPKRIP
jgi:diadenosine tetraphosphate (Ap4A) HIT family hydrolase